ncbi:MAG: 50S ribosomal protein L4, partial [Planctomycetota bacterium]
MASLPIYDLAGSSAGTFEIDSEFDADSINKQLMHDVVVMYQANARQGSHHARTRGEVSGTNKKMYRQKGTGNARAGSKRTNVRRGGGVARTIKPRDYSYRLPKKAVRLATRMAIASKINDHQACVIDGLALDAPRTKPVASFLAAIGLAGESVLIVTGQHDPVVYRSARN